MLVCSFQTSLRISFTNWRRANATFEFFRIIPEESNMFKIFVKRFEISFAVIFIILAFYHHIQNFHIRLCIFDYSFKFFSVIASMKKLDS